MTWRKLISGWLGISIAISAFLLGTAAVLFWQGAIGERSMVTGVPEEAKRCLGASDHALATSLPEFLSFEDDFAAYRPIGRFTFDQTVAMIDDSLAFCRDNNIRGLLVDITGVTGFPPPTTDERRAFATKWAATAAGKVNLAMLAPPAMIDRQKVGVATATDRGLATNVFTTEPAAAAWLLQACSR